MEAWASGAEPRVAFVRSRSVRVGSYYEAKCVVAATATISDCARPSTCQAMQSRQCRQSLGYRVQMVRRGASRSNRVGRSHRVDSALRIRPSRSTTRARRSFSSSRDKFSLPRRLRTTSTTSPLLLDMVWHDDVYATSEHGTAGWSQEYRVNADGSTTLFLSVSNAHAGQLRTDGTTLFWTQTYGTPNLNVAQQRVEVWSAPYSSDPAAVAANARRLGTFSDVGIGIAVRRSRSTASTRSSPTPRGMPSSRARRIVRRRR
jgi:hypothetical protein